MGIIPPKRVPLKFFSARFLKIKPARRAIIEGRLNRVSRWIATGAGDVEGELTLVKKELYSNPDFDLKKVGPALKKVSDNFALLEKRVNQFEAFAKIHFKEFDYKALNGHWSNNPVLARLHYSYRIMNTVRETLQKAFKYHDQLVRESKQR